MRHTPRARAQQCNWRPLGTQRPALSPLGHVAGQDHRSWALADATRPRVESVLFSKQIRVCVIKGQTFKCELRRGEQVRKPPGIGRKGREAPTSWESGLCAASAFDFASNKTARGCLPKAVDGGRGPPGERGKGERLPLLASPLHPSLSLPENLQGQAATADPVSYFQGTFHLPCVAMPLLRHPGGLSYGRG